MAQQPRQLGVGFGHREIGGREKVRLRDASVGMGEDFRDEIRIETAKDAMTSPIDDDLADTFHAPSLMVVEHSLGGQEAGDIAEQDVARPRDLADSRREIRLDARGGVRGGRGGGLSLAADALEKAVEDHQEQIVLARRELVERAA